MRLSHFRSSGKLAECYVLSVLLTALCLTGLCSRAVAEDPAAMRRKAVQFLEVTQNENGSWSQADTVGITGIVTTALLQSGLPPEHPVVAGGLKFLVGQQQADGGIHGAASRHRNYETCVAMMALLQAGSDGRYARQVSRAEEFLRGLQWDEGEGVESSDGAYGGAGYDSQQRPDMSNTQYFVEALKAAGVEQDDPAMKRVLVFISRAQNLESVHNQLPYAGAVNDGGFIYTPAKGGESKAGLTESGGHRSYGSITYAGLKSLIYAGLDAEDERVTAAVKWIRGNYTLRENPGMGQQGLFYYFQTFAKTMNVIGEKQFVDSDGNKHDWRAELTARLQELQQSNGSWINPADRWYEGDPNLVTAYCLIALHFSSDSDSAP